MFGLGDRHIYSVNISSLRKKTVFEVCEMRVIEKTCVNGKKMGLKLTLLRKSFVAKIAHVWALGCKIIVFAKSIK